MSPSESQLRAALRDGEGDVPDADRAMSRAIRIRHDRRARFTAIAGGVAAAAVVGVGTTVLIALNGNNGGDSSGANKSGNRAAGAAARAPSAEQKATSRAASGSAASSPSSGVADPHTRSNVAATNAASALTCPATADRFLLPGGGGSGQFGSTDPLFAGAAAMKVCGYPAQANAGVRSAVVGAPGAAGLTKAIDAQPATRSADSCAPSANYLGGTIEILAVNGRGAALKPVVITLGCTVSQATNGTAVRYVHDVPQRFLLLLKARQLVSPGQAHGSPVR